MTRDPSEREGKAAIVSEETLIAEFWAPLADGYAGAFGLKDDCASITPPPGSDLVVTTDGLIAGVHFFAEDDPAAVAWKALAVNISDLVAKGAVPMAYLMSLALPAPDRGWLEAFAAGLREAQTAFGCSLIGGDTDRTPGPLSVSITAFGIVPAGGMVRRGSARAGDAVYVTGSIGDAALGLALRQDPQRRTAYGLDDAAFDYLRGRFSRPRPPLAITAALRACASAALDISDGLVKDFDRLCRSSGVGGRVEAGRVPLSDAARAAIAHGAVSLAALLTGGEDYEVLATVPNGRAAEFERLAEASATRVTRIGEISATPAGGVIIGESGEPLSFVSGGWDHFSARSVT